MVNKIMNNIFRLSCNLIVLQMITMPLSSIGFAQSNVDGGIRKSEHNWNKAAEIIVGGTQVASNLLNNYNQQRFGGMNSSRYDVHRQSLDPLLALRPIEQNLISPIFSGCAVLPASAPLLGGGKSCTGANEQDIRTGYANAIIDIANINLKQLNNFQVEAHDVVNAQGKACYNRALQDFHTMFKTRENEIDKKIKFLEEQLDIFVNNAQKTKDEIKKRTAKLTGNPAKYLDKNQNLEDLLIGESTDKNNVCSSIMSRSKFTSGAKGGLEGLLSEVESVRDTPQGNGALNANEMLDRAPKLNEAIKEIATKISSNINSGTELEASTDGIAFRSDLIKKDNKALNKVLDDYNLELNNKQKDMEKRLGMNTQSLTSNPIVSGIISGIKNDNINIDARLRNFEKQTKQNCFQSLINSNFSSVDAFAKRFKNPNISKEIARGTDNAYTNKIKELLNFGNVNNSDDIETIVEQLQEFESQGRYSNYTTKPGKSFNAKGKFYNASTRLRASDFFSVFSSNCVDQYEGAENEDGFTNEQIAKNLKSYSEQITDLRKTAPSKIKSQILDTMKNCPSNKTTGISENSCNGALSPDSSNFCVRTALTCATKMKACADKAKANVTTTRLEQDFYVKKYNDNVINFKKTLLAETKGINDFIKAQGDLLNSQLNEGSVFGITPMEFKLAENQYLQGEEGIGEDLMMEDPAKYLEMAKKQLLSVKDEMTKQRIAYLGNTGDEESDFIGKGKLGKKANTYISNYESQKSDWEKMIQECSGRMNQIATADKQKNDAIQKQNEEIAKQCAQLRAFNATGDCDTVDDTMESTLKAVRLAANNGLSQDPNRNLYAQSMDQQAVNMLGQIQKKCRVADSARDNDSGIPLPGTNGIGVDQLCEGVTATKGNEYTELWGNNFRNIECVNYKKLNNLSDCLPHEYVKKMLKNDGVVLCSIEARETLLTEKECKDKDGSPLTSNSALEKYYDNNLAEKIESKEKQFLKLACIPDKEKTILEIKTTKRLVELAQGYNDYQASNIDMGENPLKVAACNGGVDGLISQKGGWSDIFNQTAGEIGRGLGSAAAIGQ